MSEEEYITVNVKVKNVLRIIYLVLFVMIYLAYYVFIEKRTPLLNSWIDEVTLLIIVTVALILSLREIYKYAKHLFF